MTPEENTYPCLHLSPWAYVLPHLIVIDCEAGEDEIALHVDGGEADDLALHPVVVHVVGEDHFHVMDNLKNRRLIIYI